MDKHEGFVKSYYLHRLDNALHSFRRSIFVSFCLISLKSYWLLCLVLSSDAVNNSYYNDSYKDNVFGASLLKGTSKGDIFIIAGISVNACILLLICVDMVLWRWWKTTKNTFTSTLMIVLSFCAQIYSYALFIPFVFHSVDTSFGGSKIMSILCLISTIILNTFFLLHDQDYSFLGLDCLDRRNSYIWDCCSVALEILSCIALSSFKTEGAFVFGAVNSGFRLLCIHSNRPFSSIIIRYVDAFAAIYILSLSVCLLTAEISTTIDPFPLVFIMLIPITHKAAETFIAKKLLRIEDFSRVKKYTDYGYSRDGDVRQLLGNASELAFEEYSHKLQSILIEEIIINHKENCQYLNQCFCTKQLAGIEEIKENLISGEERQRYLTEFIYSFYERVISSRTRESTGHHNKERFLVVNFSFLSFAAEKKGTKILAFKQVVKLLQGDNSYLQRFFLWRLHRNIQQLFEVAKHNLDEQNKQNSKSQAQGGSDLFLGIRYDENLNQLENQFIDGMREKIGFLTEIGGEHIDLVKLQVKAESYCILRTNLIEQFKSLCRINQNSQKLQYFLESYIQMMAFVAKRKELLGNAVKRKYRNSKRSYDRSIFEKDNCVVFVSLQNKIGQLLRVQNKFENIFGLSKEEVIGNDLEIIIPPIIANFHKNLLQDFHNQQRIHKNQVSTDEGRIPFVIAKDKHGWGVPCCIKFKTDFIGSDECGFTAHIKVLPIQASLLMTHGKSFILELLTKPFFEKVFVKYFLATELSKIHMSRVFPGLSMVSKKFETAAGTASSIDELEWHHTLGVLPKTKAGKQLFFNRPDKYYFVNLDNTDQLLNTFDFYLAKIKVMKKTNEYLSYHVISILSFKKLAEEDDILNALHFYQQEYRVLGQECFDNNSDDSDKQERNRFLMKKGIETLISEATQSIRKSNREDIQDNSALGKEDRFQFYKATSNDQERSPVLLESINLLRKRTQGKLSQNMLFKDTSLDDTNTGTIITTDRKMLPTRETQNNVGSNTQNQTGTFPQQEETFVNMNKSKFYSTAVSQKEVVKLAENDDDDEEERYLRNNSNNHNNTKDINFSKIEGSNHLDKSDLARLHNSTHDIIPEYENINDGRIYNPNLTDSLIQQNNPNSSQQHNQSNLQNQSAIMSTGLALNVNNATSNTLIQQGMNNNSFVNNRNLVMINSANANNIFNIFSTTDQLMNLNQTPPTNGQAEFMQNQRISKTINAQASLVQLHAKAGYSNSESQKSGEFAATVIANSEEDGFDENGKSVQLATSSVQTGNTKNFEKQKLIKEHVFSLKNSSFMLSITIFGFCSLVAILCLTVFEFVNVSLQLDLVKKCFSFISWPMDVRVEIVSILKQDGLLKLISNNVFTSISDSAYLLKQQDLVTSQTENIFSLYKQYIQSDQSELTFFQFSNATMSFAMTHDEGLMYDQSAKLLYNAQTKYFKVFDIGYIMAYYGVMYSRMLLDSLDTVTQSMILLDNFPTFNALLLVIQDKIAALTMSTLNSIITEVLILLVIVIAVNALFVSSIFPIYYFVQKRKEYILSLFATIQPSHIKGMMQPVLLFLNENKALKTSLYPEHLIKKRKAISETTPLNKFKPSYVLYSLLCFSIIIIQPIVNQILLSEFKTQSTASLNLLINLYGLKALFMSNLGLNYEYLSKVLVPTYPLYNIAYYNKRFPAIGVQNQQQLDQMFSNVTIAHSISMYDQSAYDQFLFQILEGDICLAIESFPEYITTNNYISNADCISVQNGILKKGFQLNTQYLFEQFSTLRYIYKMSTVASQQAAVYAWESSTNLADFDNFSLILLKIFNIILNFMLAIMNDQISNMGLIQELLVSFQIIALFVVFFFGWLKFYRSIQTELFQSKLLLSILSIDVIIENPYIVSYLSQ